MITSKALGTIVLAKISVPKIKRKCHANANLVVQLYLAFDVDPLSIPVLL